MDRLGPPLGQTLPVRKGAAVQSRQVVLADIQRGVVEQTALGERPLGQRRDIGLAVTDGVATARALAGKANVAPELPEAAETPETTETPEAAE